MKSALIVLALAASINFAYGSGWLCQLCVEGVTAAEGQAINSESELEQLLDGECEKFFSSWEASLCKGGVNALVPILFKYLQQDLTPQQVCDAAGMCSSRALPKALPGLGQICDTCVTVAGDVINGVNDGTLENDAKQLCAKLQGYETICDALVAQAIPKIKALIAQLGNNPNVVCHTLLPFCPSSRAGSPVFPYVKPNVLPSVNKDSGPFCQYCIAGVGEIEAMLKNYVPTIVADVKKLCASLPASEAGICNTVVDNYLQVVIDKIIAMLNPQTACEGIHLCTAGGGPGVSKEVFAEIVGVDWGPVECNFCKMLFNFIQVNFLSPDFEQGLLQDIAKVCNYLPQATQQQECLNILATYGEMLLNYVKSLIAPDHVCPMIKMCPTPTVAPSF